MEMKDVVSMAIQIADKVVALKEQGYTDISYKQVNDPGQDDKLQEMVLLDMKKDGEAVEARLFSKDVDGELIVQVKDGKLTPNKNG